MSTKTHPNPSSDNDSDLILEASYNPNKENIDLSKPISKPISKRFLTLTPASTQASTSDLTSTSNLDFNILGADTMIDYSCVLSKNSKQVIFGEDVIFSNYFGKSNFLVQLEQGSNLTIINIISKYSNSEFSFDLMTNSNLKIFNLITSDYNSKTTIRCLGDNCKVEHVDLIISNSSKISINSSITTDYSNSMINQEVGCVNFCNSHLDLNLDIIAGIFSKDANIKQFIRTKMVGTGSIGNLKALPTLHILSPSAKVSHGVSYGNTDKKLTNYLMCRGLNDSAISSIITKSFCNNYIDTIDQSCYKSQIIESLASKLESILQSFMPKNKA